MAVIGEMKKLTIGNKTYTIPSGSLVTVTRSLTSGTKSATISIDGTSYDLYAPTNTNTTYALSNALASHKFTSTLTAGGSGSGTSTATMEFAAGTGITLTDDTTNKKITIACSVTNTDTKVSTAAVTSGTTYYPVVGSDTTSAATKYYDKTGFIYNGTNGTTSAVGSALLTLGNSTASGTANNKEGVLRLYGSGSNYIDLKAANSSYSWQYFLPAGTGAQLNTGFNLVGAYTVDAALGSTTQPVYIAQGGLVQTCNSIPTKVSELTNDSGFITSYTDEKMKWTASTSTSTYYPLQSTSTATTSTANTLNSISFYQYYNTAGGYRRLQMGNATAYTSSGGAYGTIRLYGTGATYYGDLNPGTIGANSLTANRTWTLPNATGTIALTSDIPTVPTITLNGTATTSPSFYAPTGAGTSGQYLKSSGSGAPTWTNFPTIPSITLNGSSSTSPSFYAPTGAGTSGQYLKSNGSGAPSWTNFPTIPSITLNGSSTASPSFYAPTGAGTSGYYLKSNGSGAPTWAAVPTGAEEFEIVFNQQYDGDYVSTTTSFADLKAAYNSGKIIKAKLANQDEAWVNNYITYDIYYEDYTEDDEYDYFKIIWKDREYNANHRYITYSSDSDPTQLYLNSSLSTIKCRNITYDSEYYLMASDTNPSWNSNIDTTYGDYSIKMKANSGSNGYAMLMLGTTTDSVSSGPNKGILRLYGTNATYYSDLVSGAPTANRTLTLPDKTGTIALTSDIPTIPTVPTITLNGSSTTTPSFYAPTSAGTNGYVLKSNGSGAPTWSSAVLTDENVKSTGGGTFFYLTGSTSSSTITETLKKNETVHMSIDAYSGTTTLFLGEENPVSQGGYEGRIIFCGTLSGTTTLTAGACTGTNTLTLPSCTGTLKAIVASGTASNWTYAKYSDGTYEAWYKYTSGSVEATNSAGASWYRSNAYTATIPTAVGSTDILYADMKVVGGLAAAITAVSALSTKTFTWYVIYPGSLSSRTVTLSGYAKGTWS